MRGETLHFSLFGVSKFARFSGQQVSWAPKQRCTSCTGRWKWPSVSQSAKITALFLALPGNRACVHCLTQSRFNQSQASFDESDWIGLQITGLELGRNWYLCKHSPLFGDSAVRSDITPLLSHSGSTHTQVKRRHLELKVIKQDVLSSLL